MTTYDAPVKSAQATYNEAVDAAWDACRATEKLAEATRNEAWRAAEAAYRATRPPKKDDMTTYDDSYAQAKGHPPSADMTVCADFDGTICPWGPLMEDRPPFRGVRKALKRLRAAGYRIVILTSRLSREWHADEAARRGVDADDFGAEQFEFLASYMIRWGLPWDCITAEKVPALVYFDDRASRVGCVDYELRDSVRGFLEGVKA